MQDLIAKLKSIEESANSQVAVILEDAEHVANVITAAVRSGSSLTKTVLAKGIGDPEQQVSKLAGTIAALWNVIKTNAQAPERQLDPTEVAQLLQQMEVRPQDMPTATIIDAFAPTGTPMKDKWAQTIKQYEAIVATGDQQRIKSAQDKLLPVLNKIVTDIRTVAAQAKANKPQQSGMQPNFA